MGEPIDSRGLGNRGTGNRGTGNRGTGNRGLGNRGTENRGTGNRGTENRGTGNRVVGSPPPSPRYLTGVPEVVFSDVVVGDVARAEVWIFNTHLNSEAYLQLAVDAARDVPTDVAPFQIASAPQRLRPSREGAPVPIVLVFHPERLIDVCGTLTVNARWQDPAIPAEQFQVVVRGWSRDAGGPLRADMQAAAGSVVSGVQDAVAKARRVEAMQRRVRQDGDEPYPQGAANALDREFELAEAELERLANAQENGVDKVQGEAGEFTRRPIKTTSSLTADLFWFAVDIVTAGVAARVAAGVTKRFAERVKYTRPAVATVPRKAPNANPWTVDVPTAGPVRTHAIEALLSPDGLAALDEMVQATVIGSMDAARGTLAPSDAASADRGSAIDFFTAQVDRVNDRRMARQFSRIEFHTFMKPFLRREADVALTAIKAFRTLLNDELPTARALQEFHTRQAWMSFLSQRAAGSISADELLGRGLRVLADTVGVTDAARLAAPFSGKTPPPVDGVLDVYFRANRTKPLEPIVVERVYMTGVTEKLLTRCLVGHGLPAADIRLGDLRLAIRAIATAPEVETFGLVLSRDEAGNVFASDATAATPRDSNWLARRAGHRENSPGKQLDGARNVMNELLRSRVADLKPATDQA